jgi:hypothetical protein
LLSLLLLSACASAPLAGPASPVPESPGPFASPSPSPSPPPSFTAGQTVYVENTDRYGTDFRQTPGSAGQSIRVVPEGAVLLATGRSQQADDRYWSEVRDSTGVTGWVIAAYLSAKPPPLATPTFMPGLSGPAMTPSTAPVQGEPPPPTPTLLPRPNDTLVPIVVPPAAQPALAPLPPEATERPVAPTLPPLPRAQPTVDVDEGAPGLTGTARPAGTTFPTRAPVVPPAPVIAPVPTPTLFRR